MVILNEIKPYLFNLFFSFGENVIEPLVWDSSSAMPTKLMLKGGGGGGGDRRCVCCII